MANIVRDLPNIVASSSGVTLAIGSLDDAASITIFLTSSATGIVTGSVVQVSQFDPAIPLQSGVSQSTKWTGAGTVTSSLTAVVLSNISFRGLRLVSSSTALTAGEIVAFVSKQISV